LSECICLQLAASGKDTPLARTIATDCLEDLARGALKTIAGRLDAPLAEVQAAVDAIRACDPRPGLEFPQEESSAIWPEVELYKTDEGCWHVALLDHSLPALRIDESYLSLLADRQTNAATKSYLRENYRVAQNLLSAIEQRRQSLLAVSRAIFAHQETYIESGFKNLAPLTMKQVAHRAKVSESTVSRIVNTSYAQTPYGLFCLRTLFSSAVAQSNAQACSSARIKTHLQRLLAEEDPTLPLSDQSLAELVREQLGIEVSRRAINKYRGSLGIPNCARRRRCTPV
jgi:RNA polymerase sigma-54 factor